MKKDLKSNWKQNNEIVKYFDLIIKLGLMVITIVLFFFFTFLILDNKFDGNGILVVIGTIIGVVLSWFFSYLLIKRNFLKEKINNNG